MQYKMTVSALLGDYHMPQVSAKGYSASNLNHPASAINPQPFIA